jgi:RNA polymerase-binding protein DksA
MVKKAVKKSSKRISSKNTIRRPARVKAQKSRRIPSKGPVKGYSKTQLDRFRKIIVEKRKEIIEELESLKSTMMDETTGEYVSESSNYSLHMEQGTDAMEREKVFLFASREGKFLNYLDDALRRIDNGTYGFCTECGKLIDRERLEAVPHTQQCLSCKMKKGK